MFCSIPMFFACTVVFHHTIIYYAITHTIIYHTLLCDLLGPYFIVPGFVPLARSFLQPLVDAFAREDGSGHDMSLGLQMGVSQN